MAKQLWLDAADTQSDDPRLARSVQTLNFTHSANENGQQVVVTTDRSQLQAGIKIDAPAKWELTLDESISSSFDVLAAVGPIVDAAAAYPELALPESFDILAKMPKPIGTRPGRTEMGRSQGMTRLPRVFTINGAKKPMTSIMGGIAPNLLSLI
jgi:hypothetical protein